MRVSGNEAVESGSLRKIKRFLNIEYKSFKIWSEDHEAPGLFSIIERAKKRPHKISSDSSLCEKIMVLFTSG